MTKERHVRLQQVPAQNTMVSDSEYIKFRSWSSFEADFTKTVIGLTEF